MENVMLTKDTYEHILNFADDREIIIMLSLNKKFNDEKLFERVMKKRYPLLIRYRKENETWKELYVRMVFYISKLKELFSIPYINVPGYNPETFYRKYKNENVYVVQKFALNKAAEGDFKTTKYLANKMAKADLTYPYNTAKSKGQTEIMKYLLQLYEKEETIWDY